MACHLAQHVLLILVDGTGEPIHLELLLADAAHWLTRLEEPPA